MSGTSYGQYGSSGGGGSGGVTSLNSETGVIDITSVDSSVTINASGQTIDLSAQKLTTGNLTDVGTDGITVTGGTGAVVGSGTSISQHVADATHNGYLSQTDWATFNGKQAALTIGNLTDVGTDGITVTGGTGAIIGSGVSLSQHVADSTHNGYLSQTDWATFNGKQSALTIGNLTDAGTDGITVTGGSGAVIGSGTSISQHVADSTHNGYLSSTDWTTFNGKGSGTVTAVSVVSTNGFAGSSGGGSTPALTLSTTVTGLLKGNGTAISAAVSATDYAPATTGSSILKASSGGFANAVAGTDYQVPITSGDGTTSAGALTLATVNSNVGSFTNASLTVNAKGLITAAANGSAPAIGTTAKTANYTLTTTDGFVAATGTGGAFTLTLPTAVGADGHIYYITRTDTTLANAITLNTTSSQTVGGYASGAFKFYTMNETLQVISDNANWQILNHATDTAPAIFTMTVTGTTTNPTKGTASSDVAAWSRDGSYMDIVYNYLAAAGGAAGSGAYLFALPTGATADTTIAILPNTLPTTTALTTGATMLGSAFMSNTNAWNSNYAENGYYVSLYDSTHLVITAGAGTIEQGAVFASNFRLNYATNPLAVTFRARIPIANWKP